MLEIEIQHQEANIILELKGEWCEQMIIKMPIKTLREQHTNIWHTQPSSIVYSFHKLINIL